MRRYASRAEVQGGSNVCIAHARERACERVAPPIGNGIQGAATGLHHRAHRFPVLTPSWGELRLRLSRHWSEGRLSWYVWAICMAAACASAALTHLQSQRLEERANLLERRLASAQSALASAPLPQSRADSQETRDFAQRLPALSERDALGQLNEATARHNARVVTASIQRQLSTDSRLGALHLQVSLRGTYRQTKDVLADLMNANAGAVLHHARWQQLRASEIESEFQLTLVQPPPLRDGSSDAP